MNGNDVQVILELPYLAYLAVYITFMFVYTNVFFILEDWQTVKANYLRLKDKLKFKY